MTRSGRFNPVFKEAPHASEGVFSGIVSRPGVYRASHTMRRHRHVGVIGGVRKRFDACVGGGALAIRGLVRFDGRLRTHGGGAGARIALRLTKRWLEMATLKTEGAREVKAECPW